ncbi:hypothetical protein MRB53_003526 [Persea americana]|uniref:Uncharacterized protein n=1 Tax=Persea americana TaxID=3435 RepID=A0ACC2MYI7_PERAE|nr:hypothetical protein MRB53_003526 [Persea americana]
MGAKVEFFFSIDPLYLTLPTLYYATVHMFRCRVIKASFAREYGATVRARLPLVQFTWESKGISRRKRKWRERWGPQEESTYQQPDIINSSAFSLFVRPWLQWRRSCL